MNTPGGTRTPNRRIRNPQAPSRNVKPDNELRNDANGLGANPGAVEPNPPALDPDLAAVIEVWPTLPAAVKAGIVAMVKATK